MKLNHYKRYKIIIAASIVFFSGISISRAAVALEALPDANSHGDFVVGPGKQEISLDPGQSVTIDLTISNRLGVDKIFTVSEEDTMGSSDPTEAITLLGDDRGPYSLKDYIHPATTSIDIQNGYRARIPVTISIPLDAEPGGLYGSLVVGTATKANGPDATDAAAPTAALITKIGTLFFVRVNGQAKVEGSLSGFTLAGNHTFLLNEQPIAFDILYKNTGNVSVNPFGTITIKNMLGSEVGSISIDPWFAMPQSTRFREVTWKSPFLFGRYTAHAVINRGYGKVTDEMDLTFWVIPWKVIFAVLIALILIIAGMKWMLSKMKGFTIVRKDENGGASRGSGDVRKNVSDIRNDDVR